ncbi:MAG: hypothetical protein HGGPFJEG_01833 [Ignavibacteria bacterium]|nr:hypothetical protein [Ignavibacteria bacterium]
MNISNLKLFQLFKNLSQKEEKEFRKFISSPLYTSGRNYIPIFEEIKKLIKSGSSDLPAQKLYEKLYPGKKYNAQTLKNRFSELYKLGEDFLIYQNILDNQIERDKYLINIFLERGMTNFFENKYRKTYDQINNKKDEDYKFSNIYILRQIYGKFLEKEFKIEKFYANLYENSIYSICLTLINLFEFGTEFIQQEYLNRKYEFNPVMGILKSIDFNSLIKNIDAKKFPILNVVKLHYNLYKAFENLEEEHYYFEAREIFKKIKHNFSDEYMLKTYMIFIYYCTRRQNAGIKKFYYELFKLYNEKLNSGFCSDFSQKIYPVNNFRDYVYIGIEIGQLEWVENLIKKYSHLLPEENRENEINISYARLNISMNKFDSAYEFLGKVKPTNYLHYSDCSVMKLICQYELDLVEEAYSEVDRLKHFLSNHPEIPKIQKIYINNFLKIYSLLLKNLSKPDSLIYETAMNTFKQINLMSRKVWLLEKINALNGNKKKAVHKQPFLKTSNQSRYI